MYYIYQRFNLYRNKASQNNIPCVQNVGNSFNHIDAICPICVNSLRTVINLAVKTLYWKKKTKRRRNIYIYNYVIDEYEKEQKTRPDVDNLIFKDYIISQNNDVYCK